MDPLSPTQMPGPKECSWGNKLVSHIICRCLDKAAVITEHDVTNGVTPNPWKLCTVTQVEEVKILLRMFPIWVSGIVFTALQSRYTPSSCSKDGP